MSDYLEARLARLGDTLGGERKSAGPPPPGKGKKKPTPPWETDPAGPSTTGTPDPEDGDDDAATGADGPPWRKKRRGAVAPGPGTKAFTQGRRARITTWGPPQQSVNIRRAEQGVEDGDGDPRVTREHGRDQADHPPIRATGRAGGNSYTRGRSQDRAPAHRPGNLRAGGGGSAPSPSGQMGEGASGRSGSAITPGRPAKIRGHKGLYDYSADEVETALGVSSKALGGVLGQLRDR